MTAPFFGKYAGTVTGNVDPERRGRIQVSVPATLGQGTLSWARPCLPYAGPGVGFLALPPVGASVWVEFEGGDTDSPIWSGCFWESDQAPSDLATPYVKLFRTDAVTVRIDDTPGDGGLTIEVGPPAASIPITIRCDANGIEITTGASRVTLDGATVSVNDGALEVT